MNLLWLYYGDGEYATQYPAGFVILRRRPWKWELTEHVPWGHVREGRSERADHGEHKTLRAAKAAADVIARDKAAG